MDVEDVREDDLDDTEEGVGILDPSDSQWSITFPAGSVNNTLADGPSRIDAWTRSSYCG